MTTAEHAPRASRARSRVRIERHDGMPARPVHRAAAIVVGLALAALFVVLRGGSDLLSVIWTSTFGSALGTSQVLQLATPLIIAGCAAAVVQRIGMWNLGIQGQMILGAWLATAIAYSLTDLAGPLLIPLLLVAGLVGGAVAMIIPALARTYLGVNEVITTLMLSFAAELWLIYWASGPWANPELSGSGALFSKEVPEQTFLPQFTFGELTVGLGFVIAVVVALLLWAFFRYSHYGFRATVTGAGTRTAAYAGVNERRVRMSLLLLSGAIGGLAGIVIELDQIHGFSTPITAAASGYIGIVVALLAANAFSAIVVTGVLMAFIVAGGNALQIGGFSGYVVFLMTGLLLLLAASAEVFGRYRIRFGARPDEEPAA